MPDQSTASGFARQALFSGEMDVEGMEDVLALYRDLFEMNEKILDHESGRREMTSDEARMRLKEGFTLVDPGVLLPGAAEVAARVLHVVEVLAKHSEDAETLHRDIAVLSGDGEILRDLAREFLTEGEDALRKHLLSMDRANPEVIMFVLFNAMKGYFLQAAERCRNVDTSIWEGGSCPVCGGEAAVAYQLGEGGKRYLICFRCETHWRSKRLICPYCGHEDPRDSGYFFSEDEGYGSLSASVCSQCSSYIKTWRIEGEEIGSRHPEMEDLKTPGFDRAVEEEGFSRGAPNIYGIWIGGLAEEENQHQG